MLLRLFVMLMLQGVLNFVLYDFMKEVDSFLLIKEIKTSGGSRPSDRGAWGGGHPDPEIRGRSGLKNQFFGPSSLSLPLKVGGGGGW